jgi:hypothetical protein
MSLPSIAVRVARGGKKVSEAEKALEGTIEIAGKIVNKRDLVKAEIQKALRSGRSQADLSRTFKEQGLTVDNDWLKNQIAAAKGRDPTLKPDKRMRKMEANYIVEKGLAAGRSWDEIGEELKAAGFKHHGKMAEIAKDNYRKRLMQNSGPAVIDNGESGPMAPEDQPPVFNPEAEARAANAQVMGDRKMSIEEKLQDLLETARAAGRKRSADLKGLRAEGAEEAANDPFVQELERLTQTFRDNKIPEGARFMDSNNPTNNQASLPQDLDVPVAPAGVNGPVEPEFRNR